VLLKFDWPNYILIICILYITSLTYKSNLLGTYLVIKINGSFFYFVTSVQNEKRMATKMSASMVLALGIVFQIRWLYNYFQN